MDSGGEGPQQQLHHSVDWSEHLAGVDIATKSSHQS